MPYLIQIFVRVQIECSIIARERAGKKERDREREFAHIHHRCNEHCARGVYFFFGNFTCNLSFNLF